MSNYLRKSLFSLRGTFSPGKKNLYFNDCTCSDITHAYYKKWKIIVVSSRVLLWLYKWTFAIYPDTVIVCTNLRCFLDATVIVACEILQVLHKLDILWIC